MWKSDEGQRKYSTCKVEPLADDLESFIDVSLLKHQ